MELLNAFTTDELVAITLVMLQLILFAVMLGDKCLWRINDNSKHPSSARGRPDGRRNVRRTRRSAGMELPRCRSPRCSVSFRKHFPRFIRTSQDSQALFEEHRKELEVQLTQWRCGRGSGRVVHADPPVMPKLLGARQPPQCLGVEVPRPDMNKVTEEDTPKNIRRCSNNSYLTLERRRSMALARLLPRLVVIMNPAILESSSSSSSWSSSSEELEDSSGTAAGRFLGQLRARLQRYLEAWQTYRVQHRRCFRIRFKSQWWRRCWTQLRKRV